MAKDNAKSYSKPGQNVVTPIVTVHYKNMTADQTDLTRRAIVYENRCSLSTNELEAWMITPDDYQLPETSSPVRILARWLDLMRDVRHSARLLSSKSRTSPGTHDSEQDQSWQDDPRFCGDQDTSLHER